MPAGIPGDSHLPKSAAEGSMLAPTREEQRRKIADARQGLEPPLWATHVERDAQPPTVMRNCIRVVIVTVALLARLTSRALGHTPRPKA